MASTGNVVRSLSADELGSSLNRSERPPPTHPLPPPVPEQKPKAGLLKRLRKVFRINAQNVRASSRMDKPPRSAPLFPETPNHTPTPYDPAPNAIAKPVPIEPNKPVSRSRTWRTGLSNRNLASERPAPGPGDAARGSRRFISLGPDGNKKAVTSPPQNDLALHPAATHNDSSFPRPMRTNNPRSLPKRVFSSPPSLSGRPFSFGSRKRNSVNAKGPVPRPGTTSNSFGEGDSDSVRKMQRSFNARNGYDARGSMNFPPISPNPSAVTASPQHNAAAFRTIVEGATAGRVPFPALLDAMFRLEERLMTDVKDMLIRFLSRDENMEALIDRLTVVLPIVADDEGVEGPGGERERYRYSYVSSMLLSNGPIQLRRSLFLNPRHLDRLVRVLGHGTPSDPVVVRSVCKVLLSVLRDSPEDTVRAMGRRKDFIEALLSHIAVTGCPEVCLSMLSTVRCQAELKFGPSNKPVVGMMADSKLVKTLCDKLAAAAENGPLDGVSSSTIENCSRVIVGIALRALVIPRYEINDDDSDASYMMKFNRDLSSLDVFSQPMPILRLLDSGLAALSTHDTRGYALSTALTAVRYLLVTALNGQDSSLSTIRMQLLTVNTSAYEAGVRARIPKMARVLENARHGVVVETMWEKVENPLGVVRLKILELIVVLLQHCSEATAKAIAKAGIPQILMKLFLRLKLNSLLQHFVAAIVELSFTGKFSCLRRAFLIDVRLLDFVMEIWEKAISAPYEPKGNPVNYTGELLRIICAVHDFLKHESVEANELIEEIGADKVERFLQFCEGSVADKLKENGPLLCGPGELPARPMDNFALEGGYSSMGGSQGSLFLRSRGPGTTANS